MQLAFQTTATYALTVTDDLGAGRTVNISPGYFRILLAPRTGVVGTSLTAPTALITYVETQLNAGTAGWHVAPDANGFITIEWTGTLATATITWDAAHVIRNLLGFSGNVTAVKNVIQVPTYHPTHTMYMVARSGDTGWLRVKPPQPTGELATGVTYGWKESTKRFKRSFDSRLHAYDWATRISGSVNGVATPYTGDVSRIYNASNTPGITPPYGCDDFHDGAQGNCIGAAFGTYQTVLTGATTTCDRVYMAASTLNAPGPQRLEQPNNSTWYSWPGMTFWRDGVTPTDTF